MQNSQKSIVYSGQRWAERHKVGFFFIKYGTGLVTKPKTWESPCGSLSCWRIDSTRKLLLSPRFLPFLPFCTFSIKFLYNSWVLIAVLYILKRFFSIVTHFVWGLFFLPYDLLKSISFLLLHINSEQKFFSLPKHSFSSQLHFCMRKSCRGLSPWTLNVFLILAENSSYHL